MGIRHVAGIGGVAGAAATALRKASEEGGSQIVLIAGARQFLERDGGLQLRQRQQVGAGERALDQFTHFAAPVVVEQAQAHQFAHVAIGEVAVVLGVQDRHVPARRRRVGVLGAVQVEQLVKARHLVQADGLHFDLVRAV
ncbi:hypothetical protein D3C72_1738020 [compost metagenome]